MSKPDYVIALEAVYGPPNQNGFGSAVFYEAVSATTELEKAAIAKYQFFVGDLWERFGKEAWMGPWQQIYQRPSTSAPAIVAELRGIEDGGTAMSASMLLDVEGGEAALADGFDHPSVTELCVFTLGDGEAMSGLLVAGRRAETNDALLLAFLMD